MKCPELTLSAEKHIRDTLSIALDHTTNNRVMIVYDSQSALSMILTQAYRSVLPDATTMNFEESDPSSILDAFADLLPGDLVVLIQSSSFRLSRFRIRIDLFKRGIKVIEHPHLGRIQEVEYPVYLDALAYDPAYYRTIGPFLKERISQASQIKIVGSGERTCEKTELIYDSAFLDPKLNIGHYVGMKNTGGQFPIGEVFTEPEALDYVNGTVELFAFGDTDFRVNVPEKPFKAKIKEGKLVSTANAPSAFEFVLDTIREKEEVVWVRELGFGLNRAFSRDCRVSDIGTYERMCGIHLSLGAKHLQYKRPGFAKKGGFHVDVFVNAHRVEIDGLTVFEKGHYMEIPDMEALSSHS
ncbi:MAG: hypothetical protein ACE5FY_03155 [Nitrospiria bacterium]